MSDQRLRELERRWKETGSPDDEAAYLLERVRVGDLTRERLELAAYCGHEGATRALQRRERPMSESVEAFCLGLVRWGQVPCVRLARAAARLVVERGARAEAALRALEATDAWLAENGELHARRVADAAWACHGLDWAREVAVAIVSPGIAREAGAMGVSFCATQVGLGDMDVLALSKREVATWAVSTNV